LEEELEIDSSKIKKVDSLIIYTIDLREIIYLLSWVHIFLLFTEPCIGGRCLQVVIERVATTTRSGNRTVSAPVTVRPTTQTQKMAGVVNGIVTGPPAESEVFRVAVVN